MIRMIRTRVATATLRWLLTHSGIGALAEADGAETRALIDGLRRDLDASNLSTGSMLTTIGTQLHKQASITRGILLTHQVYEEASKPLFQAKRRLNAKMERGRRRQAKDAAKVQAESDAPASDSADTDPAEDASAESPVDERALRVM